MGHVRRKTADTGSQAAQKPTPKNPLARGRLCRKQPEALLQCGWFGAAWPSAYELLVVLLDLVAVLDRRFTLGGVEDVLTGILRRAILFGARILTGSRSLRLPAPSLRGRRACCTGAAAGLLL